MKIVGKYSFNNGEEVLAAKFNAELQETYRIVANVKGSQCRSKTGGRTYRYHNSKIDKFLRQILTATSWKHETITCDYSKISYLGTYQPRSTTTEVLREIDYVKNRVGLTLLFSTPHHVVYDICAQMSIFHNQGVIDVGISITPVKRLADQFSRHVVCFEQYVWDLKQRGVANIDIPVLILGITA